MALIDTGYHRTQHSHITIPLKFEYLSKTTIAFALVFFLSLWSNQNKRQTFVPEFLVWRKVSTSLRSSHCSSSEMAQSSHLCITQNRDNHGFINCKNTKPQMSSLLVFNIVHRLAIQPAMLVFFGIAFCQATGVIIGYQKLYIWSM